MATDTFTWDVLVGGNEALTVATMQAQFGDGYRQIASAGINSALESWSLSRRDTVTNIAAVRTFLKAHVISSFWWTNPWGERHLYRVKNDSITTKWLTERFVELSFTFEQAFAP